MYGKYTYSVVSTFFSVIPDTGDTDERCWHVANKLDCKLISQSKLYTFNYTSNNTSATKLLILTQLDSLELPAAKFVWVLLTGIMEPQNELSIDTKAHVVVHDEHLRNVLIGVRQLCGICQRESILFCVFFFRVEYHSPSKNRDSI